MTTLTMKEEKRLEIIQRVFRGEATLSGRLVWRGEHFIVSIVFQIKCLIYLYFFASGRKTAECFSQRTNENISGTCSCPSLLDTKQNGFPKRKSVFTDFVKPRLWLWRSSAPWRQFLHEPLPPQSW